MLCVKDSYDESWHFGFGRFVPIAKSLSPCLTALLRQRKVPSAASMSGARRADILLGISSSWQKPVLFFPPQTRISPPASSAFLDDEDVSEFKEEDVWGADETLGSWSVFAKAKDARQNESNRQKVENQLPARSSHGVDKTSGPDTGKMVTKTSERGLGRDRELGLSVAFAEIGPGLNLTSLARHNKRDASISEWQATSGQISTASRSIPQSGSAAFDPRQQQQGEHQSAPVNVPDWSQILGLGNTKDSRGSLWEDGDEEEEEERLPPHELLAKEYARSQMTSFSVFEGVGRTLKGRDLSRVRNAIWKQTGLLDT